MVSYWRTCRKQDKGWGKQARRCELEEVKLLRDESAIHLPVIPKPSVLNPPEMDKERAPKGESNARASGTAREGDDDRDSLGEPYSQQSDPKDRLKSPRTHAGKQSSRGTLPTGVGSWTTPDKNRGEV